MRWVHPPQRCSVTIVNTNDAPTTKSEVVEFTIPRDSHGVRLPGIVSMGVGEDSLARMIPLMMVVIFAGSSDSNIKYDKTEDSRGEKILVG